MEDIIFTFMTAMISLATPLLLSALGQIVTQRSGVLNLGVEGIMLVGALAGFAGAYFTNSSVVGISIAIVSGVLLGVIIAFLTVSLGFSQPVVGIGFWFLGIGLSSVLFRVFFGLSPTPKSIQGISPIKIPILSDIPVIGAFFQQDLLTYLTIFALVPLIYFILYRTRIGLEIRAVGENPRVADSLGIPVYRYRYLCVIFGCILASLAGAYLSMAYVKMFTDEMTAGQGWIAIALTFFSRWNPYLALFGALLFGGAYAFAFRAQVLGIPIPYRFLLMVPYVLTLISLALLYRRALTPEGFGKPYKR